MEDVFLVTMLNSNIDEVKTQCLTNKTAFNHCSHKDFWVEKFKHDRLPLLSSPSNINEWIKQYKLIQSFKYKAQEILMINKIESEREIDQLNTIMLNLNENTYYLAKLLFDVEDYELDYAYDIIIKNNINNYEIFYNRIFYDDNILYQLKKSINYNEILTLLISVMYLDPHVEILDQNSDFWDVSDYHMFFRSPDEQRIGYKRRGIRETLKYFL